MFCRASLSLGLSIFVGIIVMFLFGGFMKFSGLRHWSFCRFSRRSWINQLSYYLFQDSLANYQAFYMFIVIDSVYYFQI